MQPRLALPVNERRDHIRGRADAPITLLEYGDFECPDCGAAYEIIEDLRAALGSRLRFVYRHFPLTQIHLHAELAAEASEAAASQRKFWQMHDMLFMHQDALDEIHLAEYADEIGLALTPFLGALASRIHAPRVQEDFLSGVRRGVNGTPTFFLNDLRYNGPRDLDSLMAAMDVVAGTRP
ncbi:MAG TPA: DsbA family protein [Vicinamibacterales bacterium]|jgi:protein-disulfide isomerase